MSIERKTPMRPEQLELQVEAIEAVAIKMILDSMPGALGFRAVIVGAVREYLNTLPLGNFPPNFEPGQRVEHVHRGNGGYGAEEIRRGTVVEIDFEPVLQAHLRVLFDDGEERQINPDVMRRTKTEKEA